MIEAKFLITGGAGFIGSHIARRLVEHGIPVVIQDSFVQYFSPLEPESKIYQLYIEERFHDIRGKVTIVRGDTRNKDDMRRLVLEHRPTHIIHLAALPLANLSTSFSEEAVGSILTGTINLLEIIRDLDSVNRFVYTSSSMVYGDFEYTPADEEHPKRPKDIYGGAKLCGEIMTQVYGRRLGIEYTIVRPSAVYGPTDVNRRVSQIFVENALRGKPLALKGGGETVLDFTFVEDVAEGIVLAALEQGGKNEAFNMTRGEGRSLLEFAEILSRMVPGVQVITEPAEAHIPKRGALDISKARRLLGYDPKYSLEEGLRVYVDFVRAHIGG
jgi:UDP-glucose 4-epimerase